MAAQPPNNHPLDKITVDSRSGVKPTKSRIKYWIDEWTRDMARDIAGRTEVPEAVVREGLRELFRR